MSSTVALLIGGESRAGTATFRRHDPVTGALATEAAAATVTHGTLRAGLGAVAGDTVAVTAVAV